MDNMRIIFFDIEVYPNLFVVVFYDPYIKKYFTFTLWTVDEEVKIDEIEELKKFLKIEKDSYLCGYNSLGYDMNILTELLKMQTVSNKNIKEFNDNLINSEWAIYREYQLSHKTIDLMLINNYGIRSAKSTSLKKLEFSLRKKSIKDLPYHYNDIIIKEEQVVNIVKYCKYDVEVTVDVFKISLDLIKMRVDFNKAHNLDVLNSPEPDLAKKFVYKELASYMNIPVKEFSGLRTYCDKIEIKSLILPFISFKNPIYKEVLDFYESLVLYPTIKSARNSNLKLINLKKTISKKIEYLGLISTYGSGGIHASVKPGIYVENEEYMIITADFTSYYPHLQFIHDSVASHIPFTAYSNLVKFLFNQRKIYKKGTALNYAFKILINLLFGLSNSEYSALYDARATLKTTVNGMLILSMIAERCYEEGDTKILMKNTDGLEIYVKRKYQKEIESILNDISSLSSIPIETDTYSKMIIKDVNNYISITTSGAIKTKGMFEDYTDLQKAGAYHKDTSAMIIPKALKKYFIENIPVETTIQEENNIHEFCYGDNGSKNYTWMISQINKETNVVDSKLFESRFIRYFAGGSQTISKLWTIGKRKGSVQSVQAQTPVTMAMNLPKEDILDINKKGEWVPRKDRDGNIIYRYPTLNREWYISECNKIIDLIENKNKDK